MEQNSLKRNVELYNRFAVQSFPNYWFKPEIADKWNSIVRRYCNQLPEGSERFTKWQTVKLNFFHAVLTVIDGF